MICPAKSAQELLAEFRATGRQAPFEEIVRRYAAMVFHVCFQVLKNRHDAEDATQAVFLTLAVQGKTNKEIRNIGPWLQQVARRLSLDLKKARSRRAAREHHHGVANPNGGSGLALGTGLDSQEMRHILSEELNQLAPKYRLPLILHYFGGLSREQMSQELGCKAATLGVRLHRGREMLAARLSQRGVALTAVGLGLLLSYMVREAVTENLIWSTSHAASQMAAGHPIGGGMISARAMALARSAGNTLAVAKIKAIVASVLIAATAVAAGEVVSKVRPMDLRLQGPSGDRLLDLIRPKLPQLRSDATPPQTTPTAPSLAVETSKVIARPNTAASQSPMVFRSAADAGWGGSILSGRWIGSATSTQIPGIIWSNPAPTSGGMSVTYGAGRFAVGPLAAPMARPGMVQQAPVIVVGSQVAPPYENAQPKPKRRVQTESTDDVNRRSVPAQAPALPNSTYLQPFANLGSGPKLYLEPSTSDGRSLPTSTPVTVNIPATSSNLPATSSNLPATSSNLPATSSFSPIVLGSGGELFFADGDSRVAVVTDSVGRVFQYNLEERADTQSLTQLFTEGSIAGLTSNGFGKLFYVDEHHHRFVIEQPTPVTNQHPTITDSTFGGVSTISKRSGIIKGYGIAHSAAELDQNGQVIADGYGQERTLDLSAVNVIKNSIDNSHTGHNGWFAQNKGKLVLPAVAINNGQATWGENSADPQLDLINSVRISVNPDVIGSIKLALLSTDRADYPALPSNLNVIGLWHVEEMDALLASADVTVRYDSDLANVLHVTDLKLLGYDGQWTLAEGTSVDPNNLLIQGTLGNVDYFAVAGSVQLAAHINSTPEPATMLGFMCAGLILARRRRR